MSISRYRNNYSQILQSLYNFIFTLPVVLDHQLQVTIEFQQPRPPWKVTVQEVIILSVRLIPIQRPQL